jgi:hypothetical protein
VAELSNHGNLAVKLRASNSGFGKAEGYHLSFFFTYFTKLGLLTLNGKQLTNLLSRTVSTKINMRQER